jgi:hypothetical protein
MKQYRKKPVVIDAVQFDGLNPTEIKDFVGENCEVEIYDNEVTPPVARIVIHTLEGDMEVSKGDYVIKGVKGEFYPCKPDIFEQTYESVETYKSLDEAAQKVEDYYDVGEEHRYLCCYRGDIKDAFKAGAEWMAGQGTTVRKKIGKIDDGVNQIPTYCNGFEVTELDVPFLNSKECGYGNEVIVQIRKKEENK